MRVLGALVVVFAIGCDDEGKPAAPGGIPFEVPVARLDLPRADDSRRVMVVTGAKPPALVWVSAKGQLEVGKAGPSWDGNLASKDRKPTAVAELRRDVLTAIVDAGGPAADAARRERDVDDAVLARQQAIAQARAAGILRPQLVDDPAVPAPGRLPGASALSIDRVAKTAPLVVATPSAPALAIARVLAKTGGALAVDHQGALAVLDLGFAIEPETRSHGKASWLEVFTDAQGVHLVTQPAGTDEVIEWAGAQIDRDRLRQQLAASPAKHVDVLVREDTTAQTLVDLLIALDAGGKRLALVEGPSTLDERRAQIAKASARATAPPSGLPTVALGSPDATGDLDAAAIHQVVKAERAKIRYCYQKRLAVLPHLEGRVTTQIVIGPQGAVKSASAVGVDTELASCIEQVLRSLEFPPPKGGGDVIVKYPFVFESAP